MSNKLSDYFSLSDKATEEAKYFFEKIKDCTDSVGCYLVLIDIFAQALKLNSFRFRGDGRYRDAITNKEVDEKKLDMVLAYLSSEVKEPLSQVLFEQGDRVPPETADNNSYYYQTYNNDEEKTDLQTAFDQVRAKVYADDYNNLREAYTRFKWVGLPVALPSEPIPSIADVKKMMLAMATWITLNDPAIKSLNDQLQEQSPINIINFVFGPNEPPFSTFRFCEGLLGKIRQSGTRKIGRGDADNLFLKTVQTEIKEQAVWKQDALQRLADQIGNVSKVDSKTSPCLFDWIRELFKLGLGDGATRKKTKEAILAIFNKFADISKPDNYLLGKLHTTCTMLLGCTNIDPSNLESAAKELEETLPAFVPKESLKELIKAAGSVLTMISLKPVPGLYEIKEARLFAFSDFDVIEQYKNVVKFPYGSNPLKTDTIEVDADAKEYGKPYYRPTYAIIKDNKKNPLLRFFNAGTPPGGFYFLDADAPSRVCSPGLEFNFRDVTINGSTAVPAGGCIGYPGGTPYKTINGHRTSLEVFYKVLQTVTKWHKLSGSRTYDVLYQTSSTSIPDTHLIWRLPSGRGLSRAEKVDDSLCLWEWLGPSDCGFLNLGRHLGLPESRQIVRDGTGTINLNKRVYTVDSGTIKFSDGFSYEFIKIQSNDNETIEWYVLTNTPHPYLPKAINDALNRTPQSTLIGDEPSGILSVFNFAYYRKVNMEVAEEAKVIKWVSKTGSPQRPVVGDGILIDSDPVNHTVIGIALPISFRIRGNLLKFKNSTGPGGCLRPSMKNKEKPLHRAKGARIDAGTVMKGLCKHMKTPPPLGYTLPATAFGNWVVAQSSSVIIFWQGLKHQEQNTLPVNQEWCHIQGHGDGGDERLGNFVSGSYHCNTEQLAIESGQRQTTQSSPEGTFKLLATAYLFNDGGELLEGNYLTGDSAYAETVAMHNALKKKQSRSPSRQTGAGKNVPFAAFIRYKIEKNLGGEAQREKYFDHIFEGQSEFMDVHQYNILCKTAEFVLAGLDAFTEWYSEQELAVTEAEASKMKPE